MTPYDGLWILRSAEALSACSKTVATTITPVSAKARARAMKILIPFKINRLADPEPMPSHDQDKRGIPMPVAALASGADELAYLASLTLPSVDFSISPIGDHPARCC